MAWADVAPAQWDQDRYLFWLDLSLGLACLVVMQFRRRHPFAIAMLVTSVGMVSATSAGPGVIVAVSLATRRRWDELVPFAAVSIVSGMLYYQIEPADSAGVYGDLGFVVVANAVLIAAGLYIGARRALVASLKDRAERAEREQAMRVAQARTNERARIAREMHDVLAHRISLVAMHAGAMAYRTDLSPDETRRTAEVIQANAHHALVDLRQVLGMLRDDRPKDAPERPQPTLRDIPDLIDEAVAAGMNVRLTNDVEDLEPAPETIGRSAYRIIQEGLTNARKHAPNTTVRVQLSGEEGGELTVEIRNPLRVGDDRRDAALPESGLGLIGLVERAELSGGRLEHGRTASREFVVRAHLPWPQRVSAGGDA
ncbi:MAG TPA: histidine kinase [Nocardioidaceae bacterium]|nr:histidine kinase [Nocardioidaceae bacterium]